MIISLPLGIKEERPEPRGAAAGGHRSLLHITGIYWQNGVLRSFPRLFRRAETADRFARVLPLPYLRPIT